MRMKFIPAFLAIGGAMMFFPVSCIKTQSEIKPIEIKPVHITLDINIRVEKELNDFFNDIDSI